MGCQKTASAEVLSSFFYRSTLKHALQNTQNDCHQWLSYNAIECTKTTKFVFGRGPHTIVGAYRFAQGPLPGLGGP